MNQIPMAFLTPAELRQRARFVLFLDQSGTAPTQSAVVSQAAWPVRSIDFSAKLAAFIEPPGGELITPHNFIQFVLRLLARREIVVAVNAEPALALFNDDERSTLWKRLFSEVIDVPGLLVVVLRTASSLTPPRHVVESCYSSLRGDLGPLASDDHLLREFREG
jgi:hypothetical protein